MSPPPPSATRTPASFDKVHVEKGSSCSAGLDLAIFLISRRWASVNFGGRPPLYFGYSEPNPSELKLWITSRTRSSLVNATCAIAGTSIPWADSSTIGPRRQVTTDPLSRRTIRTSRRPSSSSTSPPRTRPAPVSQSEGPGFTRPAPRPQGKRDRLRHGERADRNRQSCSSRQQRQQVGSQCLDRASVPTGATPTAPAGDPCQGPDHLGMTDSEPPQGAGPAWRAPVGLARGPGEGLWRRSRPTPRCSGLTTST